jgi:hypothetical protein
MKEERLAGGFLAADCPSLSTISYRTVNGTLIDKHELVSSISPDAGYKLDSLLCEPLHLRAG